MSITREREAELLARLEKAGGLPPLPRPKVVVRDDQVKRDADVHVSRADPNAESGDRVVKVRAEDLFGKRSLMPEAKQVLGVDEGYVDGRLTLAGVSDLV